MTLNRQSISAISLDEKYNYWRSRENSLGLSQGMKGQYLLPLCAQSGFSLEKPIELTEAQDVYTWVSHLVNLSPVKTFCQCYMGHNGKTFTTQSPSLSEKAKDGYFS